MKKVAVAVVGENNWGAPGGEAGGEQRHWWSRCSAGYQTSLLVATSTACRVPEVV
jgi:hypothetical protein